MKCPLLDEKEGWMSLLYFLRWNVFEFFWADVEENSHSWSIQGSFHTMLSWFEDFSKVKRKENVGWSNETFKPFPATVITWFSSDSGSSKNPFLVTGQVRYFHDRVISQGNVWTKRDSGNPDRVVVKELLFFLKEGSSILLLLQNQ